MNKSEHNVSMSDCAVIPAADVNQWGEQADVVIIGGGAAGLSAAIGARERDADADILVIERGSGFNGTTTLAGGMLYMGGGTRVQKANDFNDTPEEMFNYLLANTPEPDEAKIRLYCEQSAAHFDWLVSCGVPFSDGYYAPKHHTPPSTNCLSWSGNEKAWPISEAAKPAPRGHKVMHESEGGALLIEVLAKAIEQYGVRVQHDSKVTNLIADQAGGIVGVRMTVFGEERFIQARRGVVIAAGAFSINKAMLKDHCPPLAQRSIMGQGNPNDDGAGILMGIAAGGHGIHMEKPFITAPFYPPESLIKGIFVNKYGQRFINEDCYHARTMDAAVQQDDGIVYLICDNETFGRPELGMQELIDAWETVEEMEGELNFPKGSLVNTVERYNEFTKTGKDSDFHKSSDWLAAIANPPFAALQCSLGKSYYIGFTLGGLDVSIDAEVLDAAGAPIPGLYAAGACASNIAQDGKGYSSGTCIGEATFFGRRGGQHAAANHR